MRRRAPRSRPPSTHSSRVPKRNRRGRPPVPCAPWGCPPRPNGACSCEPPGPRSAPGPPDASILAARSTPRSTRLFALLQLDGASSASLHRGAARKPDEPTPVSRLSPLASARRARGVLPACCKPVPTPARAHWPTAGAWVRQFNVTPTRLLAGRPDISTLR
jgi:hypothetical protein